MSKINEIYSYSYSQPEAYRFSLDSVFLAQSVAKTIHPNKIPEDFRALDLCAGCGVIGLELNFHLPQIKNIDFLEVQEIYHEHFNLNKLQAKSDHLNFLNLNYDQLLSNEFSNRYDLIVSNPPYFFKDEGLLSPNEFKNRCRFFLDSDFKTLCLAIFNALKPKACAYVLVRPGSHHGRDLFLEMQKNLESLCLVKIFDEVRGTNVIEIQKI